MELWNRWFHNRKKSEISIGNLKQHIDRSRDSASSPSQHHVPPSTGFSLSPNGIRVLLFRECERRGPKLLYDSSTVDRVPVTSLQTVPSMARPPTGPITTAPIRGMTSPYPAVAASRGGSATTCSSEPKPTHSLNKIKEGQSVTSMGSNRSQGQHPHKDDSKDKPKNSSTQNSTRANYVVMEITNGFAYQYRRQAGDFKQLREMVFGTVALAYKGSCSKLHTLTSPPRCVLSRTQPRPIPPHTVASTKTHHPATTRTLASDLGIESGASSVSVLDGHRAATKASSSSSVFGNYWHPSEVLRRTSTTPSDADSGFGGASYSSWLTCGQPSFLSPPSLPVTPCGSLSSRNSSYNSSNSSLASVQRRFVRRTADTSLDSLAIQHEEVTGSVTTSESVANSRCSAPTELSNSHLSTTSKGLLHQTSVSSSISSAPASQTKLGLAVVIQTDGDSCQSSNASLQEWLTARCGVVEGCIARLQAAMDTAYLHSPVFVSLAHNAAHAFIQEILDLLYGPRLPSPVWLNLLSNPYLELSTVIQHSCTQQSTNNELQMSGEQQRWKERSHQLLVSLIESLKELLTQCDTKDTNFFISRLLTGVLTYHLGWVTAASFNKQTIQHQFQESESASFNQLEELMGGLGYPLRHCRTLLIGSNSRILQHCLNVLSYFIRCQQVVEREIGSSKCVEQLSEVSQSSQSSIACSSTKAPFSTTAYKNPLISSRMPFCSTDLKNTCKFSNASGGITGPLSCASSSTLRRASDSSSTASCRRASESSTSSGNSVPCGGRKRSSIQSGGLETLDEFDASNPHDNCQFSISSDECLSDISSNNFKSVGVNTDLMYLTVGGKFSCFSKFTDTSEKNYIISSSSKPFQPSQYSMGDQLNDELPTEHSEQASQKTNGVNALLKRSNKSLDLNVENGRTKGLNIDSCDKFNASTPVADKFYVGSADSKDVPAIKTSKTIYNLSSIMNDSASDLCQGIDEVDSSPSTRDRLYPSLIDMDDHREVFGQQEFHPDVIAAKVKKLCRTSPEKFYECSDSKIPFIKKTNKSLDNLNKLSEPSVSFHKTSYDETNSLQPNAKSNSNSNKQNISEMRLFGEIIKSEVEDGKKVIFILGEADEEFGTPKKNSSFVSSLNHPVDTRPIAEARNVMRAIDYNRCMPPLSGYIRSCFSRCSSEKKMTSFIPKHRRTSSDPPRVPKKHVTRSKSLSYQIQLPKFTKYKQIRQSARDCSVQTDHWDDETQISEDKQPLRDITIMPLPTVDLSILSKSQTSGVAECLMGGVRQNYSPLFVLQAVEVGDAYSSQGSNPLDNKESDSNACTDASRPETASFARHKVIGASSIAVPKSPVPAGDRPLSFASLFSSSPTRFFGSAPSNFPTFNSPAKLPKCSKGEGALFNVHKRDILSTVRRDLVTATRYSHRKVHHVALVADFDDFSVIELSGENSIAVGMSPLVASIIDSLMHLISLDAQPEMIVQCLEDKFREVYGKSHILANYLLGGQSGNNTSSRSTTGDSASTATFVSKGYSISPGCLSALPAALGLDLNDLPLLLAIASTHTPQLAFMYGLNQMNAGS